MLSQKKLVLNIQQPANWIESAVLYAQHCTMNFNICCPI